MKGEKIAWINTETIRQEVLTTVGGRRRNMSTKQEKHGSGRVGV